MRAFWWEATARTVAGSTLLSMFAGIIWPGQGTGLWFCVSLAAWWVLSKIARASERPDEREGGTV